MPAQMAPAPPPEMQAAKAPDQTAVRAASAAGRGNIMPSFNSTMLTGSGGVDEDDLKVGRVLLGS